MKRFGTVVAVAMLSASLGIAVQPASAGGQTPSSAPSARPADNRVVVEDDPYTVLKPTIGTYSSVFRSGQRFALVLKGFEPRERVKVTLDGKSYNGRVWSNGSGFIRLRAPRTRGTYDIVAVGRSSEASASTTIKVWRRR